MEAARNITPDLNEKKYLHVAKWPDLPKLYEIRQQGLGQLYQKELSEAGVKSLFQNTTQTKVFEQCLEKGSVFKIINPEGDQLEGFFHTKFQVIQGNNGIAQLLSFYISEETAVSDYFPYQLSAIENRIKQAGCYRIKGVACEKEFKLLKNFDYTMSAPRYRHTFEGVTLTFVPFTKTLYYPKL